MQWIWICVKPAWGAYSHMCKTLMQIPIEMAHKKCIRLRSGEHRKQATDNPSSQLVIQAVDFRKYAILHTLTRTQIVLEVSSLPCGKMQKRMQTAAKCHGVWLAVCHANKSSAFSYAILCSDITFLYCSFNNNAKGIKYCQCKYGSFCSSGYSEVCWIMHIMICSEKPLALRSEFRTRIPAGLLNNNLVM